MVWSAHNGIGEMMVPDPWRGPAGDVPFPDYQWIKQIKGRVYCRLFEQIPSLSQDYNLPDPYDLYVISFHLEGIDIDWVDEISQRVRKPILILGDAFDIEYPAPEHVRFYSFIYWHRQLQKAQELFDRQDLSRRRITHKASAICNRITQSKLLITTALLEYLGPDCIIKLSQWLEPKNVHFRQPTGNKVLDDLSDVFWQKYFGQDIRLDDFINDTHNYQALTMDPNQPYLQNVAVHFTNESVAYSYTQKDDRSFVRPGPFLTEKTLKCLLGSVALIPVGQYNTCGSLSRLGLTFDYGFDLSWDADPGNLSRMESIIKLIRSFREMHAMDIYDLVKESVGRNDEFIWSGAFAARCDQHNRQQVKELLDVFG